MKLSVNAVEMNTFMPVLAKDSSPLAGKKYLFCIRKSVPSKKRLFWPGNSWKRDSSPREYNTWQSELLLRCSCSRVPGVSGCVFEGTVYKDQAFFRHSLAFQCISHRQNYTIPCSGTSPCTLAAKLFGTCNELRSHLIFGQFGKGIDLFTALSLNPITFFKSNLL